MGISIISESNHRSEKNSLALLFVLCLILAHSAGLTSWAAESKADNWEALVRKGNLYRDRDRMPDARRYYQSAIHILEKKGLADIRTAIVFHDIAETYRGETKYYQARMEELKASEIYKQEIKDHLLGREYSSKKPIEIEAGSLRPACYLCHENWKVVPILYGEKNGYAGEAPAESDWKFTHKPGGTEYSDQRWYCRDCHQAF